MPLAVPLTSHQIETANRLHAHLEQWSATDRALLALRERFPGFDVDSALLKVTTLNALYSTRVYAVLPMARHVQQVLAETDVTSAGIELVERLAGLPRRRLGAKSRAYLSFASKFAHFFVDADRFPILDSYAEKMVRLHLGSRNIVRTPASRYAAFVQNLDRLRRFAGWNGSNRELDHYLWLAGQYRVWRRQPKAAINVELQKLFTTPPAGVAAELDALLPAILEGTFEAEK